MLYEGVLPHNKVGVGTWYNGKPSMNMGEGVGVWGGQAWAQTCHADAQCGPWGWGGLGSGRRLTWRGPRVML